MLTVDYDRLGVQSGDHLLDLGCGGGRHAFEAYRRGADVVALDRSGTEVADAAAVLTAMGEKGEASPTGLGAATQGTQVTAGTLDLNDNVLILHSTESGRAAAISAATNQITSGLNGGTIWTV